METTLKTKSAHQCQVIRFAELKKEKKRRKDFLRGKEMNWQTSERNK